jgi:hypothetical protein
MWVLVTVAPEETLFCKLGLYRQRTVVLVVVSGFPPATLLTRVVKAKLGSGVTSVLLPVSLPAPLVDQ